jgi:hypothetical protein
MALFVTCFIVKSQPGHRILPPCTNGGMTSLRIDMYQIWT